MTHQPTGARVARHTLLNLAGFGVPLALAVVAIPITARALGPARFGLLGLAWAIVEYMGFFDLGLARATVRFVADALARESAGVRQIVSLSLGTQAVAALGAGVLLWAIAPLLAAHVFSVPAEIAGEATAMFRVVAANVVVVLMMNALRGVLEGAARFDLATAVKVPSAAAAVVIPAVGAAAGASLPEILAWVLAARLIVAAAIVFLIPRAIEDFRWEAPRDRRRLRALFGYSGWLAVSGLANPILVNFDRFALGMIGGVAAVGFYTAPYEGAARLLLIPVSMFAALFPALTAIEARHERERTAKMMESALRQLALVLLPVVLALGVFAPEILGAWLGGEFAARAATALRILAVGVFANALAHVPSVFLYAAGRPDLPAKLHVAELIVHLPLTVWLVNRFGVTGAAMAWTIRVTGDAVVLAAFAGRLGAWRFDAVQMRLWRAAAAASLVIAAVLMIARFALRLDLLAFGFAVLGAAAFAAIAWRSALAAEERVAWERLLRFTRLAPAAGPESRRRS